MQFLSTTSGEIIAENDIGRFSRPFKSGAEALRKVSTVSGERYYVTEAEARRFIAACAGPSVATPGDFEPIAKGAA